jgi:hypothetical protein
MSNVYADEGAAPQPQPYNEASGVSQRQPYEPKPIDTTGVVLPTRIVELGERLPEHVHDLWAQTKLDQGITDHPDLIPYSELSEEKKDYDRNTAFGRLWAIYALGF